MAFNGFGKNSGPGTGAPPVKVNNPFASFPNAPSPPPPPLHPSPSLSAIQRAPSPPLAFQNSLYSRAPSPPSRQFQSHSVPQRTPSPPFVFQNKYSIHDPIQSHSVLHRAPLPHLGFQNNQSLHERSPPLHQIQRPATSAPAWGTISSLSNNFSNHLSQQDMPLVSPYVGTNDSGRNAPIKHVDIQAPKRVRSPPLPYKDESSREDLLFDRNFLKRPSLSPSRPSTMSNVRKDDPQSHQLSSQSTPVIGTEAATTKPTNFPAPKRTRSPPLVSSGTVFQGNCEQDDNERELQAKAKRAARFKNELNEPMQSSLGIGNPKAALKKRDQSEVEKQKLTEEPLDMAGDDEGLESSTLIIGVCPDMCPESERGERERKGDLDQYERLDGDRNQTTKSLAVKKYTRTAEREADLIRPMPILQKTLDYLLQLLDQPYDDTFLGLYNFLWDRMRAIRMDLRMQHIFNMSAITMLEQMIRLHIIAMHELCEYKKGEGFSEGFDAHLNIEQMNKTSVELFQLYDDHRKRGIDVPTEKEFRGYYALLKLDKHPGYKVEPAELSLDLAKMTPELRQAAEVLFARKVARACRTGNFIAFFRLARKASYIQACLMHAHFGKLRSQALASLHSGLQNNQGIPVTQVAKWIGMEEENIDDLLEYHGFSIKDFEEPYMVKEGSFYNSDSEYPLKRSKLVHMKKSKMIMEDVSYPSVMEESYSGEVKLIDNSYKQKQFPGQFKEKESSAPVIDDELTEFEDAASQKDSMQTKPELGISVVDGWHGHEPVVGVLGSAPSTLSFAHSSETPKSRTAHSSFEFPQSGPSQISYESPKSRIALSSFEIPQSRTAHISFETPKSRSTQISIESPKVSTKSSGKPIYDTRFRNSLEKNVQSHSYSTSQIVPRSVDLDGLPNSPKESTLEEPIHQSMLVEDLESIEYSGILGEVDVDEVNASHDDEEVAAAKLILILRIWRRRSSKKRELREQKQLAAYAALSSLSLGLPMWQHKERQTAAGDLDIDQVMSERYERHEQSWSRLNVSDIVAAKLCERNQNARCLCWKVIYSSHADNPEDKLKPRRQVSCFDADLWLRSKIMPATSSHHDDLVISSPGLSVWRKWFSGQLSGDLTCCFSVIKELQLKSDNIDETIAGANAVLFLISECISWPAHKLRLSNLLMSIPSGSCLPLLIVNASFKDYLDPSAVAKDLGLHDVDRSRISSFLVVPLHEDQKMKHLDTFYSDEELRKGLQWLASESPLQPLVCSIKTRELVQAHLNASLEGLEGCHANKVGPEHCIAAFNGALDRSIEDVSNAANANTTFWPCPEIALLEKSSYEHRVVDLYLPRLRWSSAATVGPLLCALNDCKLPPFPDVASWLSKDSDVFYGIENQKLQLEDLLVRYLTQSIQLMGLPLARKEASIMLQTSARLDLHNTTYYIVPQWLAIFRRIFNWRLMTLHSGSFSTAHVLEQDYVAIITSGGESKLDFESGKSSNYNFNRPSLDEMVEVSCSPYSEHERIYPPSPTVYCGSETQQFSFGPDSANEGMNFGHDTTVAETENSDNVTNRSSNTRSDLIIGAKATKEADRLSKLLEQCNIVQNMIDKKLSIYFQ